MATLLTLSLLLLLGAVAVYRWRRVVLRHAAPDTPRCYYCGYDLSRLNLPRCPECGALRGFRVPLTELGLTEEEVRAGFARRRGMADLPEDGDARRDSQ